MVLYVTKYGGERWSDVCLCRPALYVSDYCRTQKALRAENLNYEMCMIKPFNVCLSHKKYGFVVLSATEVLLNEC